MKKSLLEDDNKLIGGQKKLDANQDGKISDEDFKLLRENKQDGGLMPEPVNEQMSTLMNENKEQENPEQNMLPDEEMEDNYIQMLHLDQKKLQS